MSGTKYVQMYYVNKSSAAATTTPTKQKLSLFSRSNNNYNNTGDNGGDILGAHSFCSRCGVHILHAPNSQSTSIDINVDCLNQDIVKLKPLVGSVTAGDFDTGIAVPGQWDQNEKEESSSRSIHHRFPTTTIQEEKQQPPPIALLPPMAGRTRYPSYSQNYQQHYQQQSPYQSHHSMASSQRRKQHLHPRPSPWEMENDPPTIELLFPGTGGKDMMSEPDTPTTVYTTQTDSYLSAPIPPTLTVDTRDCINDAESMVSLTSFPYQRGNSNMATSSTGSCSVGAPSPSPSLTSYNNNNNNHNHNIPMMGRADQVKYYMSRHMGAASSASSIKSSPATVVTPARTIKDNVEEDLNGKRYLN